VIDQRVSFLEAVSPQARDELAGVLNRTEVSISAAPGTLATAAGQTVVYQMATLASRLFDNVVLEGDESVVADPALPMLGGPFLEDVRRVCSELRPISSEPPSETIKVRVGEGDAEADLFVGATAWSAFVSPSSPQPIHDSGCPVGPLAAGTLGAAEVFKLAFDAKVPRALVGREYSLSLLTYRDGERGEPEPAPDLPLDLVLYGAGSIGTGFGHALVLAPQFAGPVAIVDNGAFDEKNPYKYSLLDWATASTGESKAPWLAERLRTLSRERLMATGFVGTAEQYVASLEADYRIPLAVSPVDTVEARLEIQDTLPKKIINADIAGTTVEVSVHGFGDGPCLACLSMDREQESWQATPITQAVGLDPGRAHDLIRGNLPMERADIEAIRAANRLPAEIAASLDTFLGQPLLSLWNRQVAYSDAAVNVNEGGPQPLVSTAFVSAFAGILLLAELYKATDPALAAYAVQNSYQQELLGIPAGSVFRHPRDTRGWCLCHSGFRLQVYSEKYSSD
jgi:hypothetical protein